MGEHVKKYPADAHPQVIFTNLGLEQNLEGIYYMDLSPFSPSLILISDPVLGLQIQTSPLYHRHPFAVAFLGGIVGSKSLFSTLGAEWSKQRSWFAPAFSLQHILTLVPGMVEEILVFRKHLERLAESGDIFSMNEYAMRLTIDVIGRSVGDIKLNSQSGQSVVMDAFSSAVGWTAGITDSFAKQILSPGMMWWYIRKLDKSLGGMIVDKFKEAKVGWGGKTILDLAWKGYYKETGIDGKVARAENDRNFMKITLDKCVSFPPTGSPKLMEDAVPRFSSQAAMTRPPLSSPTPSTISLSTLPSSPASEKNTIPFSDHLLNQPSPACILIPISSTNSLSPTPSTKKSYVSMLRVSQCAKQFRVRRPLTKGANTPWMAT